MKKIVILVSVLSLLAGGLFSPGVSANAYALLCRVDIGDEASEAGHNLQSWGPIEPFAHQYPTYNPWNITSPDFTGNARVIWGDKEGGLPGTPCATLTLDRCIADGAARVIRIAWLDGIHYAGVISDDSFTVEVKNHSAPVEDYQLVFTWVGQFSRDWQTADIPLPPELHTEEFIDVLLCATGPMWTHHGSYLGQVAFDYIELYGETPPEGEGRTPGYWKNHLDSWPIDTETMWSEYFDVGPDMTLVEALNLKGGKDKALTRHAAAAVLNILSGLDYPMTLQELKDLVNNAYGTPNWESAKNLLDAYNNLGES